MSFIEKEKRGLIRPRNEPPSRENLPKKRATGGTANENPLPNLPGESPTAIKPTSNEQAGFKRGTSLRVFPARAA